MVDRVESLGSIKEEEKLVLFLLDSLVKALVDVRDMIRPLPSRNKTFLGGVDVIIDSTHDAARDTGGQNPVVGISDTESASVGDKAGELFGEEEEEAVVEALGRQLTVEDRPKGVPKNGGCEIGGGTPRSKRNAVWARRSVVSELKRFCDLLEGGGGDKVHVDLTLVSL